MICASDVLELLADESVGINTKIVYRLLPTDEPYNLQIVLSDITDIDLKINRGDANTITIKDIVQLFLDDTIVGSTELNLVINKDETKELDFNTTNEVELSITTL